MDISVFNVCPAAELIFLRNKDISFQKLASAPAAFAAAAAGRRFDSGAFDGNQNRLVSFAVNIGCLCALLHGELERLSFCLCRVAFALPRRLGDVDHLAAEPSFRQAELFDFGLEEFVHCLRAAKENGVIVGRGIFFNNVSGNEAVLIAFRFGIGENMNHFELRALGSNFEPLALNFIAPEVK